MNILYLNNVMSVGGVTKCILKLTKELRGDNKIVIASSGGELLGEFEKLNVKYYTLYNMENKLPHNIIFNIKKILDIVKKENINIIHSHHRMTALLAKIVSIITGVKVIHTQHLCIEDKFKLTNIALKNIKIIAVSESAKLILVKKSKLDETKITTIYNTVDVEGGLGNIDYRLLDLKKKGYFVVAQVSRVINYKGVYDFVKIAKKTIKSNKNIRFVLIGDGPERSNLEAYIGKEGLNNYVYLLGSKNNVIDHLKYIDLLLLCSYIEGLPLAPIEAFSQGIPVVGTNIDGTNEEIKNGYNGFLVDVKDIDGFSSNIIRIYEDKVLLNRLKRNANKTYLNMFNKENYIENHKKLYKI